MSFSFVRRTGVGSQARRLAMEQVRAAIEECRADADFDKTIHGLRRRCKKLRGLLRLVDLKKAVFAAENRAVRDAAEGLAGLRDAAVMVESFNALVAHDRSREGGPQLDPALIEEVTGTLGRRVHAIGAAERRRLLADFAATLAPLSERAKGWQIEGHGFASVEAGIEGTYRRMREAMEHAQDAPSAEALHDWRKHTKYHWHHVSLLRRAAPDVLGGRRDLLDQLGELLGDHHNLHVLQAVVGPSHAPLDEAIAERQAELAARAFELGRQLTVEKPDVLRRRFEHFWQLMPDRE